MAVQKTLAGTVRYIPETSEVDWGAQVTGILTDLITIAELSNICINPVGFVLQEAAGSGTNKITVTAPASLAADYTLVMPTATGNGYLKNDGAGVLTWNAGSSTLDSAYDGGRVITADAGAVEIASTGGLKVVADVEVDGNLKGTAGTLTVSDALSVVGNLKGTAGTLTISDAVEVTGNLSANSTADVAGKLTASASLDVTGRVTVIQSTANHGLSVSKGAGTADGINVTNIGTGNGIKVNSSTAGYGIFVEQSGTGHSLVVDNSSTGYGINVNQSSTGNSAYFYQTGAADAVLITQATNNRGIVLTKTGAGAGAVIDIVNSGTGYDISGTLATWHVTKAGVATFGGDISATGGYRQTIDGWYQDDAAASQTAVLLARGHGTEGSVFCCIRAGSITGISLRLNANRAAGTITATVYKSGSPTSATVSISSDLAFAAATFAKDLYTFAVGDLLDIRITTDAGWLPVTCDIRANMEIET